MNLAETAGCSSRKEQENGDATNESERPLKKARFAWQVKGKYHLKNEAKDASKISTSTIADPDVAGSSTNSNINNRDSAQNLEMLGDYLRSQDLNNLDSVYTPTDSTTGSEPSLSKEKQPYPRYISTYEQNRDNNSLKRTRDNIDENNIDMVPMSMVFSQNFSEEQCIARWQAKQMVKGFVDNSINHVLDFWIQAPLPPEDESSRFVALDVADFINNLPGDNSVENEGILMAISAHGLQHPTNSRSSSVIDEPQKSNSSNDNFHLLTSLPSDDDSHEAESSNHSNSDNSSNNLDMAWSYSDQKNDNADMTAFPLFPDSSLSYQDISDSNQNSSAECNSINNPVANDCDFLDAAILFAIQSKGLTTFGSDYG